MGKKIAIMVPNLNNGGAEKVAADLSIYFEQKGHEVIIFTEDRQRHTEHEHGGRTVYVHRLCGTKASTGKKDFFRYLMQDASTYRNMKKRYRIDITISFMQASNLLNILSRCGDKVVVTIHCVASKRNDMSGTMGHSGTIFKYLYQLADRIVLVSDYCQRDWIRHYGDLLKKTEVINNPLIIKQRNNLLTGKTEKQSLGSNVVISVARLDGVKQQWHLVRAFKKVLEKCPEARLLIAGEGILKESLITLCGQLGISDSVHFLGFVHCVEKYIRMSKAIVITSASESWCNVIAEAMGQGVPVVVNDCPGGIRELMGVGKHPRYQKKNLVTDCGIITPRLDGKKYKAGDVLTNEECLLAEAILRLLQEDSLRLEMSKKCIENAKNYELQIIGEKWEGVISKIECEKRGKLVSKMSEMIFTVLEMIAMRHYKGEPENGKDGSDEKFVSYFNILNQWMTLKEEKISIGDYFVSHGYKRIAIYGMAEMANHLIKELEFSSTEIVYGIDRRADSIYGKFPIFSTDQSFPEADVIVVTPVFDYENIKKELTGKVNCPIVPLDEVVNYVYEQMVSLV